MKCIYKISIPETQANEKITPKNVCCNWQFNHRNDEAQQREQLTMYAEKKIDRTKYYL